MNPQSPQRLPSLDHPIYALTLSIAVGVFLLSTMRSGNKWDGDDALYIMNARNIVLGRPYAQTDYIVNPDNVIHPAAYPPGLPLLLAPVYALYGSSFFKMKVLCIVCFTLFLGVFARIARRYLPAGLVLAVIAALGIHPFIWEFKDTLCSELPFMLCCYGALLLITRLQEQPRPKYAVLVAATAAAVAFTYLIRAIGIVIFPAALLASLTASKRALSTTATALAAAALIIVSVQRIFPADIGTYVGYLHGLSVHTVLGSVAQYARVGGSLLGRPILNVPILAALVGLAFAGLALMGFIVRVRRHVAVLEWFFGGYAAFLLLYPITLEVSRYSLPLWPLLFLYCAVGIDFLMLRLSQNLRRAFAGVVAASIIGCYAARYAALDMGPLPHSIDAPPSRDLFSAIRREVPVGGALLTRKPTYIALFTDRRAAVWDENADDGELWQYMTQQHIRYIVQERFDAEQNTLINGFVARNLAALTPLFANDWFILYRVR